ncbi:MAG: CotH kinase family protein [Bacteroidales bacterium]|nr:CotH kinase family protein [Bacteroidales bacterium]
MIKLKSLLLSALLMAGTATASATTFDADGYPELYLRGEMDGSGWSVQDKFRLNRQGDIYTIHLDKLSGEFKISDDDWTINYGALADNSAIVGSCVTVGVPNGVNYQAQDLSDITISFAYNKANPSAEVTVTFSTSVERPVPGLSGTLPVLYINVKNADGTYNNEVIDKDLAHKNYFDGEYWLDVNGCKWLEDLGAESIGSADAPLPLEIKARGNYTRKAFAKKPFKLKLGAKQRLLGMSKSKHYAILAHADDNKGYLRNFTGFNLGHRIGLPWTPSQQPVEVVINGDYRGLYFLTESIRVGDGRVPVQELDDNVSDPALISGGYLVELDNYDEDNQIRLEEKGQAPGYKDALRITFDTPEEYSALQLRFVTDQFTAMNDLIGDNSDDLWSYMDIDDAARYYLVEEIISHVEAYHGSTYMYRDRGEGQKWHFSPLWDCGNGFNGPVDGFFYDHAPFGATWIASLRLNGKFNDKVRATWLWFMSNAYDGLIADIDAYVADITEAAKADRRRWRDRPVPDGGQGVVDNSDMQSRRNDVVNRLQSKIEWLKGRFGDFTGRVYDEPARDTTPAAPLPGYAQSGVEDIAVDNADADFEFYNLQGRRIARPAAGQVVIVRRGNVAVKTVIR